MSKYDIVVLGSGPGGYVTAIRASQLGLKAAIVEKENLSGICLNWGCIPTKALLKSARMFEYLEHAESYGIKVKEGSFDKDFPVVIKRSRDVAATMSRGVQFLMGKNKIDVIMGYGTIKPGKKVDVKDKDGKVAEHSTDHIIIATGARSRELPALPQGGKKIIDYRQTLTLPEQPKKMIVVGSGAIGIEFAHFYNTIGTEVTIVEFMPNIVSVEDEDISKQLEKSLKKSGINIMTSAEVTKVDTSGKGVKAFVKIAKGGEVFEADILLSVVGIKTNVENIGLEAVGIKTDRDKIQVNEYYQTNVPGYYAIGDIVPDQALAHVASTEGILCIEKIEGLHVEPINYGNVPGCTYYAPEIASVGLTEKQAREKGYEIKVGKFPFIASGKASVVGTTEGFIRVIFDAKYGEWLGCHMTGAGVTDMIAKAVVARKLETTDHEVIETVHPHPIMSEGVKEAVVAAYGEAIDI